jgi:flagellar basal-body rod modification protein FlgD
MSTIADLGSTDSSTSVMDARRLSAGTDFFKLLSAQLNAQDPLNPMDDKEFLGQLTQNSQLEQTIETNDRLGVMVAMQESLAALSQMTQSAALIGKKVDYLDPTSGAQSSGTVKAVRAEGGLVVLDIDGVAVPIPNITSIRELE